MSETRSQQPSPMRVALRKLFVSGLVLFTFVAYIVAERLVGSNSGLASPADQTAQAALPTHTPLPPGHYKDGVYGGMSADAFYGLVQVQITVQNGNVADIQFLQYPHERSTSLHISQRAMPYLTQEAISAQSAKVNVITGATLTSRAFEQSLNDALNQATNP